MQHDDRVADARRVDHWERARLVADSNLFDASADRGHRLEAVGLFTTLRLVELIACILTRVVRELLQALAANH
jgi:hypothetical protein